MAQGKKAGLGSYRYSECGSPRPQPCQDGKRCCNKKKTAPDTRSVPLLLRVADAVGIEASKAAAIVHERLRFRAGNLDTAKTTGWSSSGSLVRVERGP